MSFFSFFKKSSFKKDYFKQRPIIALAPMADYTDSPFCRVCRSVGGKFLIFREMVSAEALVRNNEKTLKMCKFKKFERPIILQIFGSNPTTIAKAAEIVVKKFNPDGIDINMGCPVPKIAGKSDSGAALMKDHERALEIIKKVKAILPKNTTLSVKTRLGWSNPEDILEFAPKLEKAGVDFLTVHGRTKMQGYSGKANWEMIGRVKKTISIPLIANGDVSSKEDAKECLKITGADGVMIGRGAIGNPWIFSFLHSGNNKEITMLERVNLVLKHAKLHLDHYGPKSMVTFRKHLLQYFKGNLGIENSKNLRLKLTQVNNLKELKQILSSLI